MARRPRCATWCADLDGALAWVTLDAGDNDPGRLWRYVATAVDRVRPGLGAGALRRLGVAGSPIEVGGRRAHERRIRAGERAGRRARQPARGDRASNPLSSIDYALAHLPANAHVVLLARVDPALRLARLRAAGALVEVRAADLAFTTAEAHELLVVLGQLELGAEEIDVLVERTEGWPAALVLAWLWLRTVEDPARAVRAFGGDNRFVAEYLSGEVLAALDEDERAFLHGAAVLGEFTAELCDGVLDRTDSAARLAELEHSNLFVSRLERGGWFRIHSLFAEYAKAELASLEPGAPARIHRRAAEWLRSRGLPVQAVEHAAAAGDHELVAQLLVEYHLPLIRSGAGRTLLRWVRTLPDDQIVEHPELAVAAATAAMLVGGQHARAAPVARARRRGRARATGASRRATSRRRRGWCARSRSTAAWRRRCSTAGVRSRSRRLTRTRSSPAALAAYARALFFAGELDEASAVAMRALEHPAIERAVPSLVVARSTLALVAVERGRLASARAHAEKAKAAVGRIGTSRSWLGANASAALGSLLAAEGSLAEAEHELASAERFFADEVATVHHTLAARPACPRPPAPRPSRRGRGDAALRAGGARSS